MKQWPTMFLVAVAVAFSPAAAGQTDTPRTVQESIEAAESAKQARIDEANKARAEGQRRHWDNQDRATRKRMRRSYKESRRIARGRTTPWWLRVLRGTR